MPSFLCAVLSFVALTSASCAFAQGTSTSFAKAASLPLAFERNDGQVSAQYRYVLRHGLEARFFQQGADFILSTRQGGETTLRLEFASPSPHTTVSGVDLLKGESNYLLGADASRFHTHIANYGDVRYNGIYPGVTLDFYGNGNDLEHDFTVAPHADPSTIAFRFSGENKTELSSSGDLLIHTTDGVLRLKKPVAYQMIGGQRRIVAADFVRRKNGDIGFTLGTFNPLLSLTIDPVFSFSTYLDGSLSDAVAAVTTDSAGNIYLTGSTGSADFPTHNPEQSQLGCNPTSPSCFNAFITKLDPTGKVLIYSTYLGGASSDRVAAIAVDANGNAIVAGVTQSSDFPHSGAVPALSCAINDFCFFVASLKPDGSGLNYSGQIGGGQSLILSNSARLALDPSGNAYLAGGTSDSSFMVTPGTLSSTVPGYPSSTLFVLKVDPTGKIIYSTVVPGNSNPNSFNNFSNFFLPAAITVDSSGEVTVAGTAGLGLPTTAGVVGSTFPNSTTADNASAGFALQLNASASALTYATYVPGTDLLLGMALNASGDLYVAGQTGETNLAVSPHAYQSTPTKDIDGGIRSGYVAELDPQGTSILAATYLDGTNPSLNFYTSFDAVAVDSLGNVFIGGSTGSSDFPMQNPFTSELQFVSTSLSGMVLAEMSPDLNTLEFGSFLSSADGPYPGSTLAALTIDSSNNLIVAGTTLASDFPTTTGAFQTQPPPSPTPQVGSVHSFVSKMNMGVPAPSVCSTSWSISFGFVPALTTSKQTFNVTNCGNAPLQFNLITSSVPTITATQSCGTVAPGGTCAITVAFAPIDDSVSTGTLSLADGAAISPQVVQLSGKGQAPDLEPASNPFNMGHLFEGTVGSTQTLFLNNLGNDSFTITALTVSGTGFSIAQNYCTYPTLSSCWIVLSFSPPTAGAFTGSLNITSNDPVHPQLAVALVGTGDSAYALPVINDVLGTINPFPQQTLPINKGPVNLVLSGSNFYPQSVVELGGVAQQSTFVSNTTLNVTIAASSLTALGEYPLTVVNPAPGGGSSSPTTMTTYQQLPIYPSWIASDSATGLLYAAMPSSDPTNPNTVLPIDPTTGTPGTPIPVGKNPVLLATSSDGAYLYVANNTDLTVQRINLSTNTVDRTFPYAPNGSCPSCYTPQANDLQSIPNSPEEVVLAQGFQVALYNDSGLVNYVPGSFVEYNAPSFSSIAFAGNPLALYAEPFTTVQNPFFTTAAITPSGLQYTQFTGANYGPPQGTGGQVVSDGTLLYTNSGEVWNPATQQMTGSFPVASIYSLGNPYVLLDTSHSQIFASGVGKFPAPVGSYIALAISSYGQQSLAAEQSLSFPLINAGSSGNLARWGSNGFAFPISNVFYPGSGGIYFTRSNALAGIVSNPVPILNSVTPSQAISGGGPLTITLNGAAFVASSVVNWNGSALATTYVSSTQLTAVVPASDIASVGTAQISVTNPTPGGGSSAAQTFTIQAAVYGATISPMSLSFGNVAETTSSTSQVVTLTNSGTGALALSSIAARGPYAETNTCGSSLAVGASCQIAVTFTPTAAGAVNGTLTLVDNAPNSPQSVSLSGTGVVPISITAAAGGSTSSTVSSGGTASYNLALTGATGFSGVVSLSCSGSPQYSSCSVNPLSINVAPGHSANFTVSVTTQSSASALLRRESRDTNLRMAGLGISTFLLLPLVLRRRHNIFDGCVFVALSCLLVLISGCGGSGGGASTLPVTPPGTYTLTVTATTPNVSTQQTLTLSVQ